MHGLHTLLYTHIDYAFDPCALDDPTYIRRLLGLIQPEISTDPEYFKRAFFNTPFGQILLRFFYAYKGRRLHEKFRIFINFEEQSMV
jgi:hypothetical protein